MQSNRKQLFSFYIEPEVAKALQAVKRKDGIPQSEQIRRAVRRWLEGKGALGRASQKGR